jgi:hypothetical protein
LCNSYNFTNVNFIFNFSDFVINMYRTDSSKFKSHNFNFIFTLIKFINLMDSKKWFEIWFEKIDRIVYIFLIFLENDIQTVYVIMNRHIFW